MTRKKKRPAQSRQKSSKPGQKRHLIIGDPHAHYLHSDASNQAADILGKFIAENQFDVVVNMGRHRRYALPRFHLRNEIL